MMLAKFIILLLLTISLNAIDNSMLVGRWHSINKSTNQHSITTEDEVLELRANGTFLITILVSVEADNAYIKNLKITAGGNYKIEQNLLISVVEMINIPSVESVKNISQTQINKIADNFKEKYTNGKIIITEIENITPNSLVTKNKNSIISRYTKQ